MGWGADILSKTMRQPNIEHHDLTKMTDGELINEAAYLLNHGKSLCATISRLFDLAHPKAKQTPPTWKIIEDLALAERRYQAILDEILFRAEMMR